MNEMSFDELAEFASNPAHGWSMGTFGAIGEFTREADEHAEIRRDENQIEIITSHGALRIKPTVPTHCLAWDSLSGDGETWGHAIALCHKQPEATPRTLRLLGPDHDAIRDKDRQDRLYDLGVCPGVISMCVRTRDAGLIALLDAMIGKQFTQTDEIMDEMLRTQPHRVMRSPAGRIEIYQPIPKPEGKSPDGPHTHLLPELVVKDRAHGSNTPIPKGFQSILNIHPRSPWRDSRGERHDYAPDHDTGFAGVLERFGLPEDHRVDASIRAAVISGATPEFADWPNTRRGRTKARITLRRLAAAGEKRAASWRAVFDRVPNEQQANEQQNGDSA